MGVGQGAAHREVEIPSVRPIRCLAESRGVVARIPAVEAACSSLILYLSTRSKRPRIAASMHRAVSDAVCANSARPRHHRVGAGLSVSIIMAGFSRVAVSRAKLQHDRGGLATAARDIRAVIPRSVIVDRLGTMINAALQPLARETQRR